MHLSPRPFSALCFLAASLIASTALADDASSPLQHSCTEDQRLFGDWSSYRATDAGPSWHRIRFSCDCRYISVDERDLERRRVQGRFATHLGALRLESYREVQGSETQNSETQSVFRFERGELYWQAGSSEEPRRYRRTARRQCSDADG